MPRAQIDERYLDAPYYLVPNDKVGQDAFAVIRDAMAGKAMVALGRVVLAKRERVIMLQPWGKGLMGTTLRYAYDVRETASYFDDLPDVTVPQDMLKLAEHILDSKAGDFEPATFADRYEEAVVAMLRTKQSGRAVSTSEPRFKDEKVFDLMEALRRSITGSPEQAEEPTVTTKAKRSPKRIDRQREMLLPIAGKKTAEPKLAAHTTKATAKSKADEAVRFVRNLRAGCFLLVEWMCRVRARWPRLPPTSEAFAARSPATASASSALAPTPSPPTRCTSGTGRKSTMDSARPSTARCSWTGTEILHEVHARREPCPRHDP